MVNSNRGFVIDCNCKMMENAKFMDGHITYRAAQANDISALNRLVESAYRGESAKQGWTHEADLLGGQRTDEDAISESLANPNVVMLVAEENGRIIGCVQGTRLDSDDGTVKAYMGMLTVDPTLQAQGLGRQLMTAIEAEVAATFGATAMEMTVIKQRSELIAYYERRGYVRTGETRPFPLDDERFGLPKTRELEFVVLEKALA